jgi:6-pyruvoyl-tetrahydropterin synthase
MSVELWATVTIECAHTMPDRYGVPAVHGHSYWVQCFVASSAADPVPLGEVQAAAKKVADWMDHRSLDELMPLASMEGVAEYVAQTWSGPPLSRIVVRRDSIGCGVEWRP